MIQAATIRDLWRATARRWRTIRAHIRRRRVGVALLVLVALGLGEPLICVLHCQLWLPLALQGDVAAQQHHHHHAQAAQPSAGAAASATPESPLLSSGDCALQSGHGPGSGVPYYVPPLPVHDAIPALALLLIVLPLLAPHADCPPGDPPRRARPRPWHPPTLAAA